MTSTRLLTALAAALLLVVSSARASTPKVFQYDQWSSDFNQALSEINGQSVHTQPGFVQGEAFGVVFKPRDQEYPIEITGIQLIMAAPPMAPDLTANAMIEIYNSANPGPAPGVAPMFSISTQDLFNQQTQSLGLELIGNYGILIQFDLSDPENHPAFITEGNIWVVVRFTDAATDGLSSWGDIQCLQILPYTCGCQNVGTVQDSLITPHANVVDIITPAGQCSGSRQWAWMEDVGITGDVFLRLMTNVAKPPCEPDCTDKECGDDGCGGVCGPGCAEGLSCWDNACVSCVPDCTSKQCGDDGCGGSCGNCTGNRVCEDFFCVVPCTPDCAGRECGSDGCGGTCGPGCASGETCLSDGTCDAPCAPDCTGKRCGDDGCGGTCGPGCVSGQTCTAAGQCQTACAPACAGKDCGDDGCGGVCGTCSGDDVCHAGACEPLCAPACGGKVCGDDGCG
ncbi:MAG: hypothetical protein KC635_00525, partial [Myxococcales bacterium]|nr:hypothetical protein [Myxococcales bacterium]